MAQFPLVLSIEPSLLPLAQANGFELSGKVLSYLIEVACAGSNTSQYRDFVFRKMFEKRIESTQSTVNHADDIADHVRDLCKLHSSYGIFSSDT